MATVKATINGVESTVENVKNASGTVLATLSAVADTETKEITVNGTYTSTKDGFSSVTVNVDGGTTPTGTKEITENGTYDVTEFASAVVNVPSSGGGSSAQGTFTPTENTFTQVINTGLSEVKGFAFVINKDATSKSVRTACSAIIDVTNAFEFLCGSNGSGSTLFAAGACKQLYSDTDMNSLNISDNNGTVTLTSKDASGCGYFVPETYYWYAW